MAMLGKIREVVLPKMETRSAKGVIEGVVRPKKTKKGVRQNASQGSEEYSNY